MSNFISKRMPVWKDTIFWGWWKLGSIVFGLGGLYSLIEGEFPSLHLPSFEQIISWWDWKIWFIFALIFALAGTLEGTYRYAQKLKNSYKANKDEVMRIDLKKSREIYKSCENIPTKIYDLYIYTRSIAVKQMDKSIVEKDTMKIVAGKLFNSGLLNDAQIFSKFATTDNFTELQKQAKHADFVQFIQVLNRTVIFISTGMAEQNIGLIPILRNDDEYKQMKDEIYKLAVGLPFTLTNKIGDAIDICIGVNNLQLFDLPNQNVGLNDLTSIIIQSMDKSSDIVVKFLLDDMRKEIEKFLNGE